MSPPFLGRTAAGRIEARWYTSEDVLTQERGALFADSWQLVASTQELPGPGSYLAGSVAGMPVLVVRDAIGQLRAFHNVCRHRGIVLVQGSGQLGRFITCPYHQWSYGLDGRLSRVPQAEEQFGGADLTGLGLLPLALTEWQGMVFVHLGSEPPSLHDAMAGLDLRLDPLLAGPHHQVAKVAYEVGCNWKLLVENHVDVYHLWYLHRSTLSAYQHRAYRWESPGPNWWSYEPLKDPARAPAGLPWLSEADRIGIGAHLLFPNLMIVNTGGYFATYDATPISPERTSLTLRVRAQADADPEPLVDAIRSFMAEDIVACEQLQAATRSPAFSVGPTARTHEEPVRHFQRRWQAALTAVGSDHHGL